MANNKFTPFFFFLMVFLAHAIAAMEWPLPDAVMVRNFGFNDQGRPVLGIVFEGQGEVIAIDDGERIFSRSQRDMASRLPSPLGAWSAVDHGDGLLSIYGRYSNEHTEQQLQVNRATPIASAGTSGWSQRNGVYFMLFDRRERRWLNASMLINPFADTVAPQILGIQLRDANGRIFGSTQFQNLSQGRYTIIVNAVDTLLTLGGLRLAPHRIVSSVNGEEAGVLSFETISSRDGVLMVNRNGLVPALQVYASYPAFEAGEVHLSRGQILLEIIVQDIVGNARSSLTRMLVE